MTPPPPVLVPAPVLLMTRAEATWLVLLPLKRLLASTPLSRKLLEVSRWPLAQMGALPRPECARAARQLRVYARRKNRQSGKAACRQRNRLDLGLVQHVAVGGVHGIHQRNRLDADHGIHSTDLQLHVYGASAVALHL